MRISNERRRDTEQRVRAAARTLLAGEIPVGGKCDITTLARQAWISRATLYRSYPHLKAEFEDQLAQRQASGSKTRTPGSKIASPRTSPPSPSSGSSRSSPCPGAPQARGNRAPARRPHRRRPGEQACRSAQLKANRPAAATRPDTASPAHPCDVRHTRDPLSHPKADATAAPQPLRPHAVTAGETRHRYSRTRRVPTKSAAAGSPA